MAQPAGQTLLIVWDDDGGSEMATGITVYGNAAPGVYVNRPFPVDIRRAGTRAQYLHFSGTNWQMPAWNIAVSSWPRGQEWRQMLQKILAHLVGGGRVVAWMGTELSAALTDDGRFSCAVDPDLPVVDLDDEETLRLRAYATGLADVE